MALYALDQKLAANAAQAGVGLEQVQNAHIRRWVGRCHGGGRSGRGIALILSGWRGFYAPWGARARGEQPGAGRGARPGTWKPLPKALAVDDAMQLAEYHNEEADPWLEARDAAMVELLYGCGLRVGELVGLDARASAAARGWVDLQAAEAMQLGKGQQAPHRAGRPQDHGNLAALAGPARCGAASEWRRATARAVHRPPRHTAVGAGGVAAPGSGAACKATWPRR